MIRSQEVKELRFRFESKDQESIFFVTRFPKTKNVIVRSLGKIDIYRFMAETEFFSFAKEQQLRYICEVN